MYAKIEVSCGAFNPSCSSFGPATAVTHLPNQSPMMSRLTHVSYDIARICADDLQHVLQIIEAVRMFLQLGKL